MDKKDFLHFLLHCEASGQQPPELEFLQVLVHHVVWQSSGCGAQLARVN